MQSTIVLTLGYRDPRTGYPRPIEDFLRLLEFHAITLVADVRATTRGGFGRSDYSRKVLSTHLARRGIEYEHFRELANADRRDSGLGGFRRMMAAEADRRLARLLKRIGLSLCVDQPKRPVPLRAPTAPGATCERDPRIEVEQRRHNERVALLCSCAQPHVCHRGVIADALELRGCEVVHITGIPAPEF